MEIFDIPNLAAPSQYWEAPQRAPIHQSGKLLPPLVTKPPMKLFSSEDGGEDDNDDDDVQDVHDFDLTETFRKGRGKMTTIGSTGNFGIFKTEHFRVQQIAFCSVLIVAVVPFISKF